MEKDRQGCSHLYPLLDHYRMGYISTKANTTLSESEIDQIVIAQADDDAAWEPLIQVERSTPALLSLPGDLAMRATFLAQLHRTKSVEDGSHASFRNVSNSKKRSLLESNNA